MQIIFICAEYPFRGRATGGFGRYVETLVEALNDQGIETVILCKGNSRERIRAGLKTIYVVPSYYRNFVNLFYSIPSSLLRRILSFLDYPVGFSFEVAKLLSTLSKREKIMIEGGDFGAELFFHLLNKHRNSNVVIKLHTPSFVIRKYNSENKSIFYLVMEYLEKMCLKNADAIYSPTSVLAKMVESEIGLSVKATIPYPYPLNRINPNKMKKPRKTVLFVGKLQAKKGIYTLINAIPLILNNYPDMTFTLVGPDTKESGKSVKNEIIKQCERLNISKSVKIINEIPFSELKHLYQKALVTVVPSYWDNFPNVVLEASTFYSPVVAAKTGGIPEMFPTALRSNLFPPGDHNRLAEATKNIIKYPKNTEKEFYMLHEYLRKRLSPKKIAVNTLKFYSSIYKE